MTSEKMSERRRRWPAMRVGIVAITGAIVAACDDGAAVSPEASPLVTVCNPALAAPHQELAPVDKLDSLVQRGIYPVELFVGPTSPGIKAFVFPRLTDALAAVRAGRIARGEKTTASCRITITVPAGTLAATVDTATATATTELLPLVIDVPDVTVRGALRVPDNVVASGAGGTTTRIVPTPALLSTPVTRLIFVLDAHPGGSAGNGAVIEGFTITSGHADTSSTTGGQGVLGLRATGFTIRGNIFAGNFSERIDLRGATGVVSANYFQGIGATCSICLAGPGQYTVRFNRLVGGGIEGVSMVPNVVLPAPAGIDPFVLSGSSAAVTVNVVNNVVSGLKRNTQVGTAFRVAALGLGTPSASGSATVTLSGNESFDNTIGLMLEAAFPVNGGLLLGGITFSMDNNRIHDNCQANMFVSFSRSGVGLGLSNNRPYLRNSTYSITSGAGEIPLSDMWIAHPAGLGNTLTFNGASVANVMRTAYDASKTC